MSVQWRVILDGAAEGDRNMAIDRAILDAYDAGSVPPTLRLYRWLRPTVSLGRFQEIGDVDAAQCAEEGIGLCRRPTGGRGVLHDDELTYSIVTGVRDGLPRGVSASYRVLCGALVECYRELGVPAALTGRPRGERSSGACYLHASHADLSLGVAKLSGSAQVWSGASCLQHGSFVMSRDVDREARVFRLGPQGRASLAASTDTIGGALGRRPSDGDLTDAVLAGISRGLGAHLVAGALTPQEIESADRSESEFRI